MGLSQFFYLSGVKSISYLNLVWHSGHAPLNDVVYCREYYEKLLLIVCLAS